MPGASPLWEMQLAALVREVPASDSRLGYPAEHGVCTSRLLRKPGYPGAWPRACFVRVRHSGRAAVLRGGPNSPTALQVHTQNICHARARNFGVESSRSMKLVSSERNVKYFIEGLSIIPVKIFHRSEGLVIRRALSAGSLGLGQLTLAVIRQTR